MLLALVTLFIFLFAWLAWKRLDWAAALVITALPAYQIRFNILFLPSNLLEAMIIVLFSVWLVKSWRARELPLFNKHLSNVRHYPIYVEIILLLAIAFVSAGVSGFSNASLGILKAYFMEPIMFFIVLVNIFKAKENREIIFWALSVSALVVSIVAIYQRLTGGLLPLAWQGSGRVTGVFAYPNALGLYLGPIIIILFGWIIYLAKNFQLAIPSTRDNFQTIFNAKIFNVMFVGATFVLSILAIYFAHSQGAIVGLAAALIVFGILYNLRMRLLVTIALAAAVVILVLNPTWLARLQSKIMLRDLDGQIRRQQWTETKKMLTDGKLLFGAGLANYQTAVAPYHQAGIFVKDYNDPDFQRKVVFNADYRRKVWQPLEIYLYPHNILLNFWVELGFAGVLLFIWIIGKYLVTSYQLQVTSNKRQVTNNKLQIINYENREIILGLMCAMIVVAVHGLVDAPYFKNDLAVLFWVMIGMTGILQLEANRLAEAEKLKLKNRK
ncbi:hypothetical protein COU00_02270, partial [Candidatus Falkowbacteria bacterium CG10_big_fil_rev_8_21_14_0_10_43_11]